MACFQVFTFCSFYVWKISSGDIPNSMRCSLSARTTPQPWWNRGGTLVEPWWNPGATLVQPSWNLTSAPPRTTPEPLWAETPKLSAVVEKHSFSVAIPRVAKIPHWTIPACGVGAIEARFSDVEHRGQAAVPAAAQPVGEGQSPAPAALCALDKRGSPPPEGPNLDSQVAAFSINVSGFWGKVDGQKQQLAIQEDLIICAPAYTLLWVCVFLFDGTFSGLV